MSFPKAYGNTQNFKDHDNQSGESHDSLGWFSYSSAMVGSCGDVKIWYSVFGCTCHVDIGNLVPLVLHR